MSSLNHSKTVCAAHSLSTKPCVGEVTEVILRPENCTEHSLFPHRLNLCQYHHQLELMIWGIKKFFDIYNLQLNVSDGEKVDRNRWQEALESVSDDPRLHFTLPDELEFWLNRVAGDLSDDGHPRSEFEYLKEVPINLGEVCLTDKQLMAVSMVFYGGVKKKRAAQAMNITSQALSDHIRAALKKIGNNLADI